MKTSKLRILGALIGVLAAGAAQAGKPHHTVPRNTAPIVQLPQDANTAATTPEPGPSVAMPPPHDSYVAPAAAHASVPTAQVQARAEQTRLPRAEPVQRPRTVPTPVTAQTVTESKHLRGGETGPVIELPQK